MKLSARWLKQEHPFELEFEGSSAAGVQTRTGAQTAEDAPKRLHSPKELVALGIAGCTGVDVVSILAKMRQPLEDLVIDTELEQTTEHPRVFSRCELTYRYYGPFLERDRVARATALSYGKYCGVSAMIKRSGCHFILRVFLNDSEITADVEGLLAEIGHTETASSPQTARAALLITGNEILSGKTQDTNGRFLARNLSTMGIGISEFRIVGDERAKLIADLQELLKHNDMVIMTGGLGPTKDDLTAEIVGEALARPLRFSPEAWEVCTAAFEKLGRKEIPESNRKQAMLPADALVLANHAGTAAGFAVHTESPYGRKTVVALPGVPWECEAMFEDEVRQLLPEVKRPIRQWGPWNIWGIGESAIQSQIKEVEDKIARKLPDVEFSFQAHAGYVTYLFKTRTEAGMNANPDLSPEEQEFEQILGNKILYRGAETLVTRLMDGCRKAKVSISVAESCTGGRIASELTSQSGSSDFFYGGVVAYSNVLKSSLLGVSEQILTQNGAVSREAAAAMASGAAALMSSRIALSVTGIAGPTGGTPEKPVGTVCFGLSLKHLFGENKPDPVKFAESFARLTEQGWVLVDGKEVILVAERSFGAHLTRDVLQKRSSVFGLCSLVAVVESFRGYCCE
ncbi:MAG: CinA family nicotinamide mononucleotide deamidase-related protein [Proteobacteria bacterium]|nr:CinA family nicotinamide mononucleotide deamidase-related protein [Pseudomonadota bacterium]